jgi:hypothetical protein
VDAPLDMTAPEDPLGLEAIVGSAKEPHVGALTSAPERTRHDVVELEQLARLASHAVVAHEAALSAVPGEHLPPYGAADLLSRLLRRWPGSVGLSELRALERVEELVERAFDDDGGIPVRGSDVASGLARASLQPTPRQQ